MTALASERPAMRPTILRIDNPRHVARVLEARRVFRIIPPSEGVFRIALEPSS